MVEEMNYRQVSDKILSRHRGFTGRNVDRLLLTYRRRIPKNCLVLTIRIIQSKPPPLGFCWKIYTGQLSGPLALSNMAQKWQQLHSVMSVGTIAMRAFSLVSNCRILRCLTCNVWSWTIDELSAAMLGDKGPKCKSDDLLKTQTARQYVFMVEGFARCRRERIADMHD